MFSKRLDSVVGIGVAITVLFGSAAIAQTNDQSFYIQVGTDRDKNPIVLDLASVQGSDYTLLEKHGNGIKKRNLHASCSEGRLFSKRFSLYASTGELTGEGNTEQEIFPQPGTPDAASMEIVCQVAQNSSSK